MNKKAALEMSVQSIVIFVITFIVVGLLIGLITSMFQNIEDNLGIIETPPTVNPTPSKPIAVPGDKIVLRTNRETPVVFGVYLSDSIEAGDLLYVDIIRRDNDNWVGMTVGASGLDGQCVGFSPTNGVITFATNYGPATTNLLAGQTLGIRAQVKSASAIGTYTCFMRVHDGTNELAFGTFELEIKP